MENFRKVTLSQGMTLLVETHPYPRSVSLGVWIKVGSRFETTPLNGVSHFLEHLVFKGTKSRNALDLAIAIESLGGELNAFTERETTCFHATVLSEHVDIALDVLSDLVIRPNLNKVEFEKEKKVLLQELAMVEESPEESIYDSLLKQIWKGQKLGQSIIGTRTGLGDMTHKMLQGFYEDHYQPSNILISVAGNVDFEKVRAKCESLFKFDNVQDMLPFRSEPTKFHSRHWFQKTKTDRAHLLIGFEGVGVKDPKRYEHLLVSFVLGGGMGSRLFQEVREKAALAYSVDCDYIAFSDTGLFSIYAATGLRSVGKTLAIIGQELNKLCDTPVGEEELQRVKSQLKGMILLSEDQMDSRQESLARNDICLGRYVSCDEIAKRIDQVQPKDIQATAQKLFVPSSEAVVALAGSKPKTKKLSVFS